MDNTLMKEGTISDLLTIIEEKLVGGIPIYFYIATNEYGKRNRKIRSTDEEVFACEYDTSNVAPYLFDLDISGWSVQCVKYFNKQWDDGDKNGVMKIYLVRFVN